MFVYFFFFQAEDGIRDGHVTGVQTCALPIYGAMEEIVVEELDVIVAGDEVDEDEVIHTEVAAVEEEAVIDAEPAQEEIGRASCRERVESWEVAGAMQEKRER